MLFFPLINVKMPTIVGILTFMSRKNFMLCWVEHEKSFITSGPGFAIRRPENSLCQLSSKRVPFSNQGRISQRKERDGLLLSPSNPQWLWETLTFLHVCQRHRQTEQILIRRRSTRCLIRDYIALHKTGRNFCKISKKWIKQTSLKWQMDSTNKQVLNSVLGRNGLIFANCD